MNPTSLLKLTPLCLCLAAGAAQADLEPYSLGASETLEHDSNVSRVSDSAGQADWFSTTELRAAVNQALGRDQLFANLAVDYNRYRQFHDRDYTGYAGTARFDWSTIGDLSGSLGAESQRKQYFYGFDGEAGSTTRNLQTNNHVFAHAQLGGMGRLSLFTGIDASQRNYSATGFRQNDEHQWTANGGMNWSTSPDLTFGLVGSYTRGLYPHFGESGGTDTGSGDAFHQRSVDATVKWQLSGATSMDGSVGYTTSSSEVQSAQNFVNGSLNLNWTPEGHFKFVLGLARNSNSDASSSGYLTSNNVLGSSVNNIAHMDLTYALTAKISLQGSLHYIERRYDGATIQLIPGDILPGISGSNRTGRVFLSAHYTPTRTTDLNCGAGREVLHADTALRSITPAYTDTIVQCAAAINFD
jgi:hypothetical protein